MRTPEVTEHKLMNITKTQTLQEKKLSNVNSNSKKQYDLKQIKRYT